MNVERLYFLYIITTLYLLSTQVMEVQRVDVDPALLLKNQLKNSPYGRIGCQFQQWPTFPAQQQKDALILGETVAPRCQTKAIEQLALQLQLTKRRKTTNDRIQVVPKHHNLVLGNREYPCLIQLQKPTEKHHLLRIPTLITQTSQHNKAESHFWEVFGDWANSLSNSSATTRTITSVQLILSVNLSQGATLSPVKPHCLPVHPAPFSTGTLSVVILSALKMIQKNCDRGCQHPPSRQPIIRPVDTCSRGQTEVGTANGIVLPWVLICSIELLITRQTRWDHLAHHPGSSNSSSPLVLGLSTRLYRKVINLDPVQHRRAAGDAILELGSRQLHLPPESINPYLIIGARLQRGRHIRKH